MGRTSYIMIDTLHNNTLVKIRKDIDFSDIGTYFYYVCYNLIVYRTTVPLCEPRVLVGIW